MMEVGLGYCLALVTEGLAVVEVGVPMDLDLT